MIIKIKTPGEDNWRFYDNARAVQSAEIDKNSVPQIVDHGTPVDENNNFGFLDGDVWTEVIMNPQIPDSGKVTLISFETTGLEADHVNLYTNSTVYLLNDNGKTIERLY